MTLLILIELLVPPALLLAWLVPPLCPKPLAATTHAASAHALPLDRRLRRHGIDIIIIQVKIMTFCRWWCPVVTITLVLMTIIFDVNKHLEIH